jgi:hypothetical protein
MTYQVFGKATTVRIQTKQQVWGSCCTRYSELLLAGQVRQYRDDNNSAPAASLQQIVNNSRGTVLVTLQSLIRDKEHAIFTRIVLGFEMEVTKRVLIQNSNRKKKGDEFLTFP